LPDYIPCKGGLPPVPFGVRFTLRATEGRFVYPACPILEGSLEGPLLSLPRRLLSPPRHRRARCRIPAGFSVRILQISYPLPKKLCHSSFESLLNDFLHSVIGVLPSSLNWTLQLAVSRTSRPLSGSSLAILLPALCAFYRCALCVGPFSSSSGLLRIFANSFVCHSSKISAITPLVATDPKSPSRKSRYPHPISQLVRLRDANRYDKVSLRSVHFLGADQGSLPKRCKGLASATNHGLRHTSFALPERHR
jgi:hypothetical protein